MKCECNCNTTPVQDCRSPVQKPITHLKDTLSLPLPAYLIHVVSQVFDLHAILYKQVW